MKTNKLKVDAYNATEEVAVDSQNIVVATNTLAARGPGIYQNINDVSCKGGISTKAQQKQFLIIDKEANAQGIESASSQGFQVVQNKEIIIDNYSNISSGQAQSQTPHKIKLSCSNEFEGGQISEIQNANAAAQKSNGKKGGIFGSKNQKTKQQSNYEKKREIQLKKSKKSSQTTANKVKKVDKKAQSLKKEKEKLQKEQQILQRDQIQINLNDYEFHQDQFNFKQQSIKLKQDSNDQFQSQGIELDHGENIIIKKDQLSIRSETVEESKLDDIIEEKEESHSSANQVEVPQEQKFNLKIEGRKINQQKIGNRTNILTDKTQNNEVQALSIDEIKNLDRLKVIENDWTQSQAQEPTNQIDTKNYENQLSAQNENTIEKDENSVDYDLSAIEDEQEMQRLMQLQNNDTFKQLNNQQEELTVDFKQIEKFQARQKDQQNQQNLQVNVEQSLALNKVEDLSINEKNLQNKQNINEKKQLTIQTKKVPIQNQTEESQQVLDREIENIQTNNGQDIANSQSQDNIFGSQLNNLNIHKSKVQNHIQQKDVNTKVNKIKQANKSRYGSKSSKMNEFEFMNSQRPEEELPRIRTKTISQNGLSYKAYKSRMDRISEQDMIREIKDIKQFLIKSKISCFKYNYSFQEIVQNFNSFQAYIHLSDDGEELIITNRKPREKLEYINEEDPDIIENVRNQYLNNKRRQTNLPTVDNDYLPTELDEELDEIDFRDSKSSASCKLSEIQGFVYGGMSSRFWVHRKNINSMPPDKIDTVPFHSWNCITLQLKNRDVDLVIRSQTQMNMFLKFLIYSLQTWDGRRGTATEIVRQLRRKELLNIIRLQGREALNTQLKEEVTERCQYTVYRQVFFKYMILKFRHKISFIAFQKTKTIPELFYEQIIQTYDQALEEGIQIQDEEKRKMQDKIFIQITSGFMGQFKALVLNTIAKNELWDQINSFEFYKILRSIQENDSEMQKFDTSTIAWKNAVKQLEDKKVNELTCVSYFNKKNKEPIDTSSPIGRKNQLDQKELDRKKQANQLFKVFQKNSCLDLFKDLKTDEKTEQYEQKSHAKFLHYKFKRKTMKIEFDRIRMLHALHLVDGRLYLKTMLRRIILSKDMFILEIEQGKEVFVQQDLSMDQLPYSFRYYDQLIQMIFHNIKTDRKEFYGLKKAIALTFYQNSYKNKLMCKLGLKENGMKEQLSFQPAVVNQKKRKEIDYFQNPHTLDIQRSRYIQIDNDIENEDKFKQEEENTNNRTAKLNKGGINISKATNTTHVKFRKPTVVNKERQDFIVFKGRYAVKQCNIKKNGEKLLAMQKVNQYVEENIEQLWQASKHEFLNFDNTKTKMGTSQYLNQTRLQKNEIKARAQFEKMIFEQADEIIQKRVCQVKVKKQDYLKGVCDPKNEYELKALTIDRFIENDYLFFGGSSNYNEKDLYDIKIQCKKVEIELRQRQRERERSKTLSGLEIELNPLLMNQMNSFEYVEQRHLIANRLKQMIDNKYFTEDQLKWLQVGQDGNLNQIKMKKFYRRICKIADELPVDKAKYIKENLLPQNYFEEQDQRSMSKSQYVSSRQSGFSSKPTLETKDSINRANDESVLNTHNVTLNDTKIFNDDSGSGQQDIRVMQEQKYFLHSKSECPDRKLADMTVYQNQQAAIGKTNLYQISEYTQENE